PPRSCIRPPGSSARRGAGGRSRRRSIRRRSRCRARWMRRAPGRRRSCWTESRDCSPRGRPRARAVAAEWIEPSQGSPERRYAWRSVKKALWEVLAVGIALAGAWGYGELVRRENDQGQPVRLLAIAEEQSLALSFSRRGRLTTRVPEEGEAIASGAEVARIEEPVLSEDATDIERQISQVQARDTMRLQEIEKLRAQFASVAADERRIGSLVQGAVSPAANLETLQHQREAIAADIRAREAEKGQ